MSAKVSNLFNTGIDINGGLLPVQSVDPHYKITSLAGAPHAFVCQLAPTWVRNTPTAQWISQNADNHGDQDQYEYETTFDLQDFRLISTVQISGKWAADDQGTDILLNGRPQRNVTQSSFRAFAGFTIDDGFQPGLNTVVFKVSNAKPSLPDPTGLLVQFDTPRVSDEAFEFEYAAKFVCGKQAERENMMLARGFYATTINIHNPTYGPVRIYKKLALTFPPVEEHPGKVYDIALDTLGPDEALKVDGNEIQRLLFPQGLPAPGHIEGFVVVQSHASLDVVGVYTTAALDDVGRVTEHSAIEIVQVRERHRPSTPPKGKELKESKDVKELGKDVKDGGKDAKDAGKDVKDGGKDVKDGGKDVKDQGKDIKEEDVKVLPDVSGWSAWGDEVISEPAVTGGAPTFIAPEERPSVGDSILREGAA